MAMLLLGLVIFLLPHSLNIFAPAFRAEKVNSLGSLYKGIYAAVSALGLVLIVYGYSSTRSNPVFLWHPPAVMSHIASVLMLIAMILLAARYVPGNRIKAALGHPMLLATKLWAVAHLLANGRLGDIVLFLGLLAWAVMLYIKLKRRDRSAGVTYAASPNPLLPTLACVAIGIVVWALFVFGLHELLIGVAPISVA